MGTAAEKLPVSTELVTVGRDLHGVVCGGSCDCSCPYWLEDFELGCLLDAL